MDANRRDFQLPKQSIELSFDSIVIPTFQISGELSLQPVSYLSHLLDKGDDSSYAIAATSLNVDSTSSNIYIDVTLRRLPNRVVRSFN